MPLIFTFGKVKISISLIVVFTLLALNAFATLQPYEVPAGGSLADKLIEATQSGGILRQIDPKNPPTPQISRYLKENNLLWTPTLVWTPVPGDLSLYTTPRGGQTQSEGQVNESSAQLKPETTVEGSSVRSQPPLESPNLAGTWSLDLNGTPTKLAVLTLFQVEEKVFGSGSMKNGSETYVVGVSGSRQDDQIYLDITSIGTIGLYSLVLTSSGDRRDLVSGDYRAYMPDGRTWVGKVQGRRAMPTS